MELKYELTVMQVTLEIHALFFHSMHSLWTFGNPSFFFCLYILGKAVISCNICVVP